MNEQTKQRIAYLVEHGGLYDDPLDEVRARVRLLTRLVGVVLALAGMHLVVHLLR